jgi:RNA polymerase sigma factor for flagellar operon FliA
MAQVASPAEELIRENRHLVERIARGLVRRLPDHVEFDDLVQTGMVGLLEAADRYTAGESAAFATFATYRIRGAMFDSLRAADWRPRSLRRRQRDIEAAQRRIEVHTGAAAAPRVIAAALGVTLERYYGTVRDSDAAAVLSLEEQASAVNEPIDGNPRPDEALEHEQAIRAVTAGLRGLPPFDQTVLRLYYEQGFLLREIGSRLAVTESRVCQIHKRIIARLRVALRDDLDGHFKEKGAFSRRPYRSRVLPAPASSG